MTKQDFSEQKSKLLILATEEKDNLKADLRSRQSIEKLLVLLDKYNYHDRIKMKVLLTKTII